MITKEIKNKLTVIPKEILYFLQYLILGIPTDINRHLTDSVNSERLEISPAQHPDGTMKWERDKDDWNEVRGKIGLPKK